jgi:hypothetical protein
MEALALRLGFKSCGDRLPIDLSLEGTPIARASAVWSVMEGNRNGIRVIAFDCRIGPGKGSWQRTVIAALSPRDVFSSVPSESSYTVDHSGDWAIFYSPKELSFIGGGLMPLPELEARLLSLR